MGGAGRGRSNKIVGPSCPRFGSSRGASVVYVPIPTLRRLPNAAAFSAVRCTAIPTCADRGNASAVLSVCCSPHRQHLPAGRGLKSSATPPHPMHLGSALVSTAGRPHGGNLMQGEWRVLGGGGRTKSWAPVAIASAHPAERALYMYRFPPCADRRTPPHFPSYVVPRFPPAPTAATPAQFSPSAAPLTVRTCLRAAV